MGSLYHRRHERKPFQELPSFDIRQSSVDSFLAYSDTAFQEPDPRDIRPYRILTQTLVELKKRWKQDPNYHWICDQFKSLRQDLTVQRIKNEFTVEVYEIHARMALEAVSIDEIVLHDLAG